MTSSNPEAGDASPLKAPSAIRVYLTDDDPQFAKAVADLLENQPGMCIVRIATSVETTLADLTATDADVLVLDIYLDGGESLEAIPDIKQLRARIKILVVTGGGYEDQQVASILAGANGFLYKPFTSSDLARAIGVVHKGKVFFDAAALTEALKPPPYSKVAAAQALSKEDYEFLDLLRQGLPTAAIATKWNTAIKAVYQRRFRLKTKLGLRSAKDLISFARSVVSRRVLVVDDEPMVRESVQWLLTSAGHKVETAGDALEALKKIEEEKFDLILADLRLPGMQGDQLAHEIKSRNPSQRVILLTGFPPNLCPPDCDQMLLKPFSAVELRKAVAS